MKNKKIKQNLSNITKEEAQTALEKILYEDFFCNQVPKCAKFDYDDFSTYLGEENED